MQCFPAPDFSIVRSTKLTVRVWYSIPGDSYGLRNVVEKSRKYLKITPHLIKVMIKIHVFDRVIHQEYRQIQIAIFWSHLYKCFEFFQNKCYFQKFWAPLCKKILGKFSRERISNFPQLPPSLYLTSSSMLCNNFRLDNSALLEPACSSLAAVRNTQSSQRVLHRKKEKKPPRFTKKGNLY